MAEERAETDVTAMLICEFLDHLGAALGVGAVILGDDLDGAASDAAIRVDQFHRRLGRAAIPAPIGRADAGAVLLKPDANGFGALGVGVARPERQGGCGGPACQCLERTATGGGFGRGGHGRSSDQSELGPQGPFARKLRNSGLHVQPFSPQAPRGVAKSHRPKTVYPTMKSASGACASAARRVL